MDVIHKGRTVSIYERTDYIVNLDSSVPLSLASTMQYGIASESGRRNGFPPVDRGPHPVPVKLAMGPKIRYTR
jgi:hypothetical protein